MRQTSLRSYRTGALVAAIALVLSSCAGSNTSTVASDTTVPPAGSPEPGDAPSNRDTAVAPTVPTGDASVGLDWDEAGISGGTFIDQLLVTDEGLVAYRFAHGPMAWVSEDGIDWTPADLVIESTSDEIGVFSITTGGPGYIAHGSDEWNPEALEHNDVIWASPDGFVWTRHELNLEYPDLGVFASVVVGQVVGGPNGLLLVGRMDRGEGGPDEHRFFVWTSDDGSDWNLVADAFPDGAYIGDVLPNATGFITKGFIDGPEEGGSIWSSTDGTSWDDVETGAIDAEPYGLTHLDLGVWNDKVLAVAETEAGFTIWGSSDGDPWEQLPASPLLTHTDELRVSLSQFSAGPAGIVLAGELRREPQSEPPLVMEKDGLVLTLDFASESGRMAVTDGSIGTLLIDADVLSVAEGEVDGVAFSEDFGSITITHPETGAQTTFAEEDFEEARIAANEAAGIEPGSEGEEPQTTSVIWFSPDGQRWTSVDVDETFGATSLPDPDNGVTVRNDAVILRWLGHPEDEGGSEEDPPDIIWIGTLADSP